MCVMGIQVQNTIWKHKRTMMFLLCALKSQNTKDASLKPHQEGKPPKHEIVHIESSFNKKIPNYKKLMFEWNTYHSL